MIKKLFNKLKDESGFLQWAIPAAISLGSSLLGNKMNEDAQEEGKFVQAPEYTEATESRKGLFNKLQAFGSDPMYGAISPGWANIWENAQNKVRQYFWGSPTEPGLINKVKASAARRGVSDSPALQNTMARLGATESQQLSDLASQQSLAQAQFGETARQNWLNQMMQLSQQKPSSQYVSPQQKTSFWGDTIALAGNVLANKLPWDKLFPNKGKIGGPAITSGGINVPTTYTPPK